VEDLGDQHAAGGDQEEGEQKLGGARKGHRSSVAHRRTAGPIGGHIPRRSRKNAWMIARQSSSSTPETTSSR
jgi:hypothetical protein